MRFSDFKTLALPLQAHIICQEGVYLNERKEDNHFIELYKVDSFYVEVYYRLEDNEIVKFLSFHDTALLEPYVPK